MIRNTAKLRVVEKGRPVTTKNHEQGRVKSFYIGRGLPVKSAFHEDAYLVVSRGAAGAGRAAGAVARA
jgi:hypothetical protein